MTLSGKNQTTDMKLVSSITAKGPGRENYGQLYSRNKFWSYTNRGVCFGDEQKIVSCFEKILAYRKPMRHL